MCCLRRCAAVSLLDNVHISERVPACRVLGENTDELLECLKELLRTDRQWLPEREGYSLYVRPFMFSNSHTLGIARPTRSTIAIMLSPVGPYFATGAVSHALIFLHLAALYPH